MGLGPWHLIAIIVVILIFFGPSRLPSLGKSMGEAIRGFKKGMHGDEIDVTDHQRRENLNPSPEDQTEQDSRANTQQNPRNKTRS